MGLKRLDKLIALNCNVSRKEARTLIKDAAVTVNGRCVLRAEELVDVEVDDIDVKGYNFTAKGAYLHHAQQASGGHQRHQ